MLYRPVRALAARDLAGSFGTAGSCSCSPGSEGPGRRTESPGPDWPGYPCDPRDLLLRPRCPCCSCSSVVRLDSLHLLHPMTFLLDHHDLQPSKESKRLYLFFLSPQVESVFLHVRVLKPSLIWGVSLTCRGAVDLSQVSRGRDGGHHKVKGDGEVHGGQRIRTRADHPDLVVSLEIQVGRASWGRNRKKEVFTGKFI